MKRTLAGARTVLVVIAVTWPTAGWAQGPALATPDAGVRTDVQISSQTFEIARQLRCPVCVSESVGDSSSAIAVEMRSQIEGWLAEGYDEAEILGFFQERYGDWILLEPPRRGVHLWVWWLPGVVLVVGVVTLSTLTIRWVRAARSVDDDAPTDEERARIDAALRDHRRTGGAA